jgi:hypothetical protein
VVQVCCGSSGVLSDEWTGLLQAVLPLISRYVRVSAAAASA